MVVYIDLIFLLNVFVDFIFLLILEIILKEKIILYRIILAAIFGGTLVISFFLNYIIYNTLKIFGGLILITIGTKSENLIKYIIKNSLFYLVNFAFVGVLSTFHINTLLLLLCSITLILALLGSINLQKYYIIKDKWKYNVIVTMKNKKLHLKAFLDSGNNITNNEAIPIIFIDKKFEITLDKYEYIIVKTVNGIKQMKAYEPDKFHIQLNKEMIEKKVLIIYEDINEECLLNYKLLI